MRELILKPHDWHKAGGWMLVLFFGLVMFAIVGFFANLFFTIQETEPWGSYTDGTAYLGDLEGQVVTRHLDPRGHPIVDEIKPTFQTVRCGPPEPVELKSERYYFIGERSEVELRQQGPTEPFTFPPIDSDSGCGIITFSSTPMPPLELIEDGKPFFIRLDLIEQSGRYLGVSVFTETMVWGEPAEGTVDRIELTVP